MVVRIEKSGNVWTVILSRPETRNAINPQCAEALQEAFLEFEKEASASVAVFWGEGGSFCSGWDLKHAALLEDVSPLGELKFPKYGSPPRGAMGPSRLDLDKPVIAAIAGPAVAGGMELALWCDFRVMEESAYFGVYCRRWGIPLIDGGTVRLPRIVGQGRALEIILTGRKVPAEECIKIGLCEYVVENGKSRDKAEELAHQIARFPQSCLRSDRRSVKRQHGLSVNDGLIQEWENGLPELSKDGLEGAVKFRNGKGRHGLFNI